MRVEIESENCTQSLIGKDQHRISNACDSERRNITVSHFVHQMGQILRPFVIQLPSSQRTI